MTRPRPALATTALLAATATLLTPTFARADAPVRGAEDRLALVDPQPTPIMPLGDVRIGMKGYGLTVFHGTKIEPFPVEVVSVISDFSPRRGTVWIRSEDPRLVVSGPVQGMSGSPIFLWEEGEDGTLGEGGRLIGAFAYGYSMVKECLAGVQPIELMRGVGERTLERADDGDASARVGAPAAALQTLTRLQQLASAAETPKLSRFRLDAITQLLRANTRRGDTADTGAAATAPASLPRGPRGDGAVQRMLLPMAVGSSALADFVSPLLEPLGLAAFAGPGGTIAGAPPAGIDPDAVQIEPGSVLAIPLAFGDMDLSASGTVTDVLPDGTVLGFGHAMFGQGDVSLPLATGYVHFVVPRITTSFKQAGSLRIAGTITQDEMAAVAGVPEETFDTAPMTVAVTMPGQPREEYDFQVVNHPLLTPVLTMMVAQQSIVAAQDLPPENTLRLKGSMTFTGDRTLAIDSLIPGGSVNDLFFELTPPIATLMNNQHESLQLESIDLEIEVAPTLQIGSFVHGRIDQAQVAPGETLGFSVVVQPYGGAMRTYRGELRIPMGLAEGDYQLMIVDGASYALMRLATRPHRTSTASVDDLAELVQETMEVDRDAFYAVLQLPEQGIAVGRVELPQLPSSRRAIIATPTSTMAVPFIETVEAKVDTETAVEGQLAFTVAVRERFPVVPQQSQQQGGGSGQRRN